MSFPATTGNPRYSRVAVIASRHTRVCINKTRQPIISVIAKLV